MKTLLTLASAVFLISSHSQASVAPGLWSTGCVRGLKKEQNYHTRLVVTDEHFYQDANCADESFLFSTRGRVEYPSENATYVDFVYIDIRLSVFKKLVIDDFNSRKVCGESNWELSVPKSITGKSCALFNMQKESKIPSAGDIRYGIYGLENNKLYYGKLTQGQDSSSPQKRPTELNRTIEYIFQHSF